MAQQATQDPTLLAERWVGVVSHDLRTPLTAIRMAVDMLGIANLDPSSAKLVSRVGDATHRAQRLIEDLLDFSQVRGGRGLLAVRECIDVHASVADALSELSLAFPKARLVHIKNGPGTCSGDRDRLAQALGNLVSNAVTYGAPDRPITVTSETTDGQCTLSVHNDGAVIEPDDMATLFEPMVRADKHWSNSRSLGLGLFIVREISRAHAGEVAVLSSAEHGTLFTVTFPNPI
jgi:sigma-B regulation protein RsbU (phosphoserine phosphatase)